MEIRPSLSSLRVTAPSATVRQFDMVVRVSRAELVPLPGYRLSPWLTIRVDTETQEAWIAAGVTAKRTR